MARKYFAIFLNNKKLKFLVIFFFSQLCGYSQNDTNDVIALQNKSELFQQTNQLDSILFYENEALIISKKINYRSGIAHSLSNFGLVYKMKGDYPKALENLFKALGIYESLGYKAGIIINLGNIGTV